MPSTRSLQLGVGFIGRVERSRSSNPSSRSSSEMMRETFAAGRSACRAVSLMLPVRTAASRMRQAARSFLSSAMTMSLIWEYP